MAELVKVVKDVGALSLPSLVKRMVDEGLPVVVELTHGHELDKTGRPSNLFHSRLLGALSETGRGAVVAVVDVNTGGGRDLTHVVGLVGTAPCAFFLLDPRGSVFMLLGEEKKQELGWVLDGLNRLAPIQ